MKKLLLALILSTCSAYGATTNLTFGWDVPAFLPNTGYVFYELQGATRTILGATTSNRFTVNGYTVGSSRTFTVVATNIWGSSGDATPYIIPPTPPTPSNLAPVTMIFTNTPIPSVLELSENLENWSERVRFKGDSIELLQIPSKALLFGRVKPLAVFTPLPIPATRLEQ